MTPNITLYSVATAVAIAISLAIWLRMFRKDGRMLAVYLGALFGAMIGAKLVYLLAEGWMSWGRPDQWQQWLTGKSILGALLGGYAGVEFAKYLAGYRSATGDYFALVVPASIALGRVGCLTQGCCLGRTCEPEWWALQDRQGVYRWPAVPVEIAFNVLAVAVFLSLRKFRILPGQHFHIYLMAYGIFRTIHEPLRETPGIWGSATGYQIASLLVFALGAGGFFIRMKFPPPGVESRTVIAE
jgi:phosphatidylglycerol:prolipoprotein diacylglycerol transferase